MIRLQRLAALAVISFFPPIAAPVVYGAALPGMERATPILFEPVPGDATLMVGHAPGAAVVFHARSVAMHFEGKSGELGLSFPGAGTVTPSGASLEKSETNYLLGNDPAQWRTHVPNYARVAYKELYPGVDAVFYGNGHEMEHDFIVSPGAD